MAQDPLHVLWVEPHFPGRLGAVADWLVRRRGYRCWFYCHTAEPREHWPASVGQGLEVQVFGVGGVAREQAVAWSRTLERSLCYSYGCWEVLEARRPRPIDLIVGRSAGLGSTLFAPVYAPAPRPWSTSSTITSTPASNDLADEAGADAPPAYIHWRRSANAIELLDLEQTATWPGPRPTGSATSSRPSTATTSGSSTTASTSAGPAESRRRDGETPAPAVDRRAGRSRGDARRQLRRPVARPPPRLRPILAGGQRLAARPARRDLRGRGRPGRPARAGRSVPQPRLSCAPAADVSRRSIPSGSGSWGRRPRPSSPRSWPPATCTWPRAGPIPCRPLAAGGDGRRLRRAGLRHGAAPRGPQPRPERAAGRRQRSRGARSPGPGRAGRPGRAPAPGRRRGRAGPVPVLPATSACPRLAERFSALRRHASDRG